MQNILICDDDRDIVNAIEIYLSMGNYNVLKAHDGNEAVSVVKSNDIQLAILDVMMPNKDGISAMEEIREFSNIPIILLTAKSEDTDKIMGLGAGADDYVTKPFNPTELLARVKSQLRRYTKLGSSTTVQHTIEVGGIILDDHSKQVTVDGDEIKLTPTEYDILKLLLENPGKVFSPKQIYEKIWTDAPIAAAKTVAVHIRHLREKIEKNPSQPLYIKVVWGQGYRLLYEN